LDDVDISWMMYVGCILDDVGYILDDVGRCFDMYVG